MTLLYGELDAAVDFEEFSLQAPSHGPSACPAQRAGDRRSEIAVMAKRIRVLTGDNIASRASPVKGMDFGRGTYYHSAEIVSPLNDVERSAGIWTL